MRLKLQSLAGALLIGAASHSFAASARADQPTAPVHLSRGVYQTRFYSPAEKAAPRALIVFGSGDGGWSYWEERVCSHLAAKHFAVAGVDFNAYASADFSAGTLRRDFQSLVAELRRRLPGTDATPVLYGGWSMGAEQSLPASAEPEGRAPGLLGLILVAPGARGRFGLRLRDRMGLAPTGPDTFSLHELAPHCADLRMAVFHGGLDALDDLKWSEGHALDLRRWTVPRTFHDFSGASDEFLTKLDEALDWLLATPPAAPRPAPSP